ncbi:hypothetical protein BASA81_003939 [Batrachochytrium salamandrivorans]|nr:hypothetical protein BASA81_003939 [Batrachochytrium salamandrivorans]
MVPAAWREFALETKSVFDGKGGELSREAILQASAATNPKTVKFACVEWAKKRFPKPATQEDNSRPLLDILVSLTTSLFPFSKVCQQVDQVLGSEGSSETNLLLEFKDWFLTPELLDVLAVWARQDIALDNSMDRLGVAHELQVLGWASFLETCFIETCYETIRDHVQTECSMQFTQPHALDSMLVWCYEHVIPWFTLLLPDTCNNLHNSMVVTAHVKIEFHLYQQFGLVRSREIFEIVTNFPDSLPAVDDLKMCLLRTQQTKELIQLCREALSKRLLHVGTNTNLILLVYVRLTKTLMRLDARGILLDACSSQIKLYLRSRPETIKCIVQALTNEVAKNSDLAEELGLMEGQVVTNVDFDGNGGGDGNGEGEEEDDSEDMARRTLWDSVPSPRPLPRSQWEPDPIEAKSSSSQLKSSMDVLGNLVRVYGSKEVFVTEYRQATSERLLKSLVIDLDAEISRLEMLKLRFGESLLLPVDVMVRDIADSKRANLAISHPFVESLVLSRLYWPQFASATMEAEFALHPRAKLALAEFAHKYSTLKKPRKLTWSHGHGVVELELTFEDGSKLHCESLTPLQCNIILHFQDRSEWDLSDLAEELGGMEVDLLRKRVQYWVSGGVLVETTRNMFEIAKQAPSANRGGGGEFGQEEEEEEWDEEDAEEDEEEEDNGEDEDEFDQDQVDDSHFTFVSTMLTNLGEQNLESIHKNLQLFSAALPMGYDRTEDDLQQLLDACVAKGTLEISSTGKFQLPPQ